MKMPIFSIIVPAFNVELFIGPALQSLCDQTFTDFEVLITDDGSTDRTAEVISLFTHNDERFKSIRTKNSGLSAARNISLLQATGKYIYFFDSDDLLVPTALEEWHQDFIKLQIDAICFDAQVIDEDGEEVASSDYERLEEDGSIMKSINLLKYEYHSFFCQSCCYVCTASLMKDLRFINGIIHEDTAYYGELFGTRIDLTLIRKKRYFQRRIRRGSIMKEKPSYKNIYGYQVGSTYLHDLAERMPDPSKRIIVAKLAYEQWIHAVYLLRNITANTLSFSQRFDLFKSGLIIAYRSKFTLFSPKALFRCFTLRSD